MCIRDRHIPLQDEGRALGLSLGRLPASAHRLEQFLQLRHQLQEYRDFNREVEQRRIGGLRKRQGPYSLRRAIARGMVSSSPRTLPLTGTGDRGQEDRRERARAVPRL